MPEHPSVIVIGASGYAGAIAADLLWRHPRFELAAITAREDAEQHPYRAGRIVESVADLIDELG